MGGGNKGGGNQHQFMMEEVSMPRGSEEQLNSQRRRDEGREGRRDGNDDSYLTVGEEIERFRLNQVPISKEKRNLQDLNSGTARKLEIVENVTFEKMIKEKK